MIERFKQWWVMERRECWKAQAVTCVMAENTSSDMGRSSDRKYKQ